MRRWKLWRTVCRCVVGVLASCARGTCGTSRIPRKDRIKSHLLYSVCLDRTAASGDAPGAALASVCEG